MNIVSFANCFQRLYLWVSRNTAPCAPLTWQFKPPRVKFHGRYAILFCGLNW